MSDNQTHIKRMLKLLNKTATAQYNVVDEVAYIKLLQKKYRFDVAVVTSASNDDLVRVREKTIIITQTGRSYLKRLLNPDMPFVAQHGCLAQSSIKVDTTIQPVLKNNNECSLSRLYFRKDKEGKAWLDHCEYQAGERLRADFEKAQLQPTITSRWSQGVTGKNSGGNSVKDISDFSFDARRRIEKTIATLGPELSGVAIDVCCFLKGLETVEREKGWPPRSAKLLLKTALSVLVRHYGISSGANKRTNRFWGSNNYRPEMFS